jgi:hypothetical protein
MAHMTVQEAQRDLVEGRPGRIDLRDDVDAVPVFLDHPGHSADLSLDLAEPAQELILRCRVSTGLRCHDLLLVPMLR